MIVVDTGRHPWHSDGIIAFAQSKRLPVVAIVNTHWHLDHSSGNRRVKAAYPEARVYTTRAVERTLAPGGFLVRNLAAAKERRGRSEGVRRSGRKRRHCSWRRWRSPMACDPMCRVEQSGPLTLAGRPLSARVAADAVTDADLWLYDEATRVAVIGDLVTLPAPFFETACPARWQAALDEVWATPFTIAVPGHGAPMSRADFDVYRRAFGAFRACVGSDRTAAVCAADWTRDVGPLLGDGRRSQAGERLRRVLRGLPAQGRRRQPRLPREG